MINGANNSIYPNSLLHNSAKLGNSTPSLQNASSSSSLSSNSNRPPFYNINNSGSSTSLTSALINRPTSNDNDQNTQSADFPTNKYNHLAHYQQQQNFLSKTAPVYRNCSGSSSSVATPPYNNNLNLNSSFNSSMTYFRNNSQNSKNSIPVSATLNSLLKHQISAPTVAAPLPPNTPQSAGIFNNPSYFLPPPPNNNFQRHSQQENWFNTFTPNKNEQDMLDDGFLNLFKSTDLNNTCTPDNTTSNAPNLTRGRANSNTLPHRYNQSHFNISNKTNTGGLPNFSLFNNPNKAANNQNNQAIANEEMNTNNTLHVVRRKKKKRTKKNSIDLIDLETCIDEKSRNNNLSIVDLFDPLAQPKISTSEYEETSEESEPELKIPEIDKIKQEVALAGKKPSPPQTTTITTKPEVRQSQIVSNRIVGFKIFDLTSSDEFSSFNKSINKLSQEIKLDSKKLANLIVFSPLLDCPISQRKNIRISVRYAGANDRYLQEVITPSLNATVETVVYHVLSLFEINDLDPAKYLLKIHGSEEYLPINANLADLKYFHDCLTVNRDPVLILTEIDSIKKDPDTSSGSITVRPFKVSSKFEKNKLLISRIKIEKLLQSIEQNHHLIEETTQDIHSHSSQISALLNWCINLKEKLKVLVTVICKVHFHCIARVVDKLEFSERSLQGYQQASELKDKQPLMMNNNDADEGYCIIDRDTDESLAMMISNLVETSNEAMHAVVLFVNCAANSFNLPFRLKPIYEGEEKYRRGSVSSNLSGGSEGVSRKGSCCEVEKIEIIQAEEKLFIYFKGLSRLSDFLSEKTSSSINNLFLRFSIYNGTQQLDSAIIKLDKHEKLTQKKLDFFTTDYKILFKSCDMCLLPREALLVIQLCTINLSNNAQLQQQQQNSSNGYSNLSSSTSTPVTQAYKCLAWTSKSLFDENLTLRNGDHLLAFYPNEILQVCTSASNIYSNTSPVIQIAFMTPSRTKLPTGPNEEPQYVYPHQIPDIECNLKDFQSLDTDTKETLLSICNKSVIAKSLTEDDKDLLHKYYLYLNGIPNALAKVYLSCSSWDYSSIIHFIAYLRQCDPVSLSEALELLLPCFSETELRNHAVRSLQVYSEETLALYLPQMLEALKFEHNHNSELVSMLLTCAFKNLRFAHKLYWQLKEFRSRADDYMYLRYELVYQALMFLLSKPMVEEIEQENFVCENIDRIGMEIKKTKDHDKLISQLELFAEQWAARTKSEGSARLPFNISYCTRELEIKSCSVISSFTMPLKLVFKNIDSTANSIYTIYKIGDDLRQDMFVLQLINVMNQLWIMDGLELSVLTFTCLQTGERRGFIEMITNAETLKEIQKGEVMKAFKQGCINDWLKSHNPNPNNFKKAVRNFTKSCAAYSVATYLLGICDRHNDNIMVKYTGHMFHIDFGKYLGDAQTFVGFKRDRTPMLFTLDMFHVINQGKEANALFQEFVEMCCKAFQILRKNYHLILTLIELMTNSGIPGLNQHAIQFVYKNLMLDVDEDRASNAFKKLIHESLSKFASFNFAIHTLAQPKTVNSSNYFSFVTHTYNSETDGKIINIALDEQNSTESGFKCVITRETDYDSNEVFRSFEEFCELYQLLLRTFPTLRLTDTPPLNRFKEHKQLARRKHCIYLLLKDLMSLQSEINQSDIIYTFFHSILRDQKEDFIYLSEKTNYDDLDHTASQSMIAESQESYFQDIKGQIKVKLKFKDNKFFVNCLQCRNLRAPNPSQSVSSLKPYVKCYLRPDSTKATKKKVQALFNGANPIFTETMEYDISLIDFKNRTLEISVVNNNTVKKEKIGSVEIKLYDLDFKKGEYIKWYELR